MQNLTLRKLANTKFKDLYLQLLQGGQMTDSNTVKLLAISVLLLNHDSPELKRLGYRIILFYSNLSGKYEALYDVALNSGLHPVSAAISNGFAIDDYRSDSFLRNIVGSYIDTFRENNIVLTEQQAALKTFIQTEYKNSSVVVAPTSYGKSELIMKSVKDNPNRRVLILVPSKALLSQTKKRLIDADIDNIGKIVTHPEMYSEDRISRTFVLTQERLNRLLNEHSSLSFDMVFVDEAHNLLQSDRRNELLATMLCILGARNSDTSFKFLTPFLCNELNLRVRHLDMTPKGFRIDEYIKSERFYTGDFRADRKDGRVKLYDHFLDEWLDCNRNYTDCFDLIKNESLSKNIIYGNKKKSLEAFATDLAATLPFVDCPLVNRACDELKEAFDTRYRLIDCLRKGVMYHHGSIPDTVRLYLEHLFTKSKKVKYLVCNSTLLEGVNLPIERLFLFDYTKGNKNLTSSQFKNLIGRVNRFSDVFSSKGNLAIKKLESNIYLLGIDKFTSKRSNLQQFYKRTVHVTQVDQDSVNNVLLEATKLSNKNLTDRFEDAVDRLENLHPGIVKDRDCNYVKTRVGKLLIANSISEINVLKDEAQIEEKIELSIRSYGIIEDVDTLLRTIKNCFIDHLDENREYSDLTRLKQPAALKFYAMILDWKLKKKSTKEVIRLTLRYWNKLIQEQRGEYVYVGSWGDTKYGDSLYENWVKISTKNDVEKINLAIVRLKEEDDFFDHKIFRFVEVLNEVGAINPDFYKMMKYGTIDEIKIKLVRDGFSRGLSELISESYPNMIQVAGNGDINVDPKLVALMISKEESELLIFEARMNLPNA